jgi:hypothetical protein
VRVVKSALKLVVKDGKYLLKSYQRHLKVELLKEVVQPRDKPSVEIKVRIENCCFIYFRAANDQDVEEAVVNKHFENTTKEFNMYEGKVLV